MTGDAQLFSAACVPVREAFDHPTQLELCRMGETAALQIVCSSSAPLSFAG